MPDLVRNVLSTAPIVAALLAVLLANAPRSQRARQYPMPAVALAYAVVALVILYRFNGWLDGLLETLIQYVPALRDLYSTSWLYILENTFAVTVFLVIKLVLRPLLARFITGGSSTAAALVARVYEYDKDYGIWFIQKRFANLREFYRNLYVTSIIVTVGFVALSSTFSSWPGFFGSAFPAIAALVIGEVFFAIDGLTRREFQEDILGEADDGRRVVNYGALRGVLRDTFKERVLADGVNLSSADAIDSFARLDQLEHSESSVDQIAAAHFKRLKASGLAVDTNLIDASVAIMKGSSVVINNPFYSDLTPYLSLPTYYHLLQYRKCLIIAGRDALADDLAHWISEGLESITGLPDLWNVEVLSPTGREDVDVGVLRFSDLHNLDLIRSYDAFLEGVECVILAEPSRMLATGQLGLSLVLSRCGRVHPPVFVAFDRNHDGLVDALSHLMKVHLTEVVASALPRGASAEMVWKSDGPHMHATILPAVTRYLGVGTEISAVALKHHVSRVEWVGGDKFPVNDMMWITGQYYSQINAFADLALSQDAWTDAIVPRANPWATKQTANTFMIVEDEIANVYETIRLYATRAESAGFINLIADDYLLRDYMIANSEIFAADPKAIPSIVPDFARTERNTVLRLVLTLLTFEVSDVALERELELSGQSISLEGDPDDPTSFTEQPVVRRLRQLIDTHMGVANVVITRTRRRSIVGSGEEDVHDFYRIAPGSALDEAVSSLRPAYFFVEDEVDHEHYIGALLYGHVYQTLLPSQFVTYAGTYFEVQGIGAANHGSGVILRRAAEHVRDRRVYRQLRDVTLTSIRLSESMGSQITVGGIEVRRAFATVSVATSGYLELPSRSDLEHANRVDVSGIPVREHSNKALLEIRLPNVEPSVRRTITVLLNELFVTTFPQAHQYVMALTEDDTHAFGDLLSGLSGDCAPDSIYIVEDSLIDLGLIVAVERHWRRFFDAITDYLEWYSTPKPSLEPTSSTKDALAGLPQSGPDVPPRGRRPGPFRRFIRWVVDHLPRPARHRPPAVTGSPEALETDGPALDASAATGDTGLDEIAGVPEELDPGPESQSLDLRPVDAPASETVLAPAVEAEPSEDVAEADDDNDSRGEAATDVMPVKEAPLTGEEPPESAPELLPVAPVPDALLPPANAPLDQAPDEDATGVAATVGDVPTERTPMRVDDVTKGMPDERQ